MFRISSIDEIPIGKTTTVLIKVDEKKNLDDVAVYAQNKEKLGFAKKLLKKGNGYSI